MNNQLEDIKSKALPILKEAGIIRSALFGSCVRGDMTETSDIDILAEFPQGTSLFDVVGLQIELEEALGKKVDIVSYKSIKPLLKESILSSQFAIL